MMMTKPTFTDEFKQGVVQYVLELLNRRFNTPHNRKLY